MPTRLVHLAYDANDPPRLARFWATALGWGVLYEDGDEISVGPPGFSYLGPGAVPLLFVPVPDPKTVKNRVHLDVHCATVAELTAAGAVTLNDTSFPWTVLIDPDGQEFCAFVRAQPPTYRLYELGVDCADPASIADWWARVFGVRRETDAEHGYCWIPAPPGAPFDNLTFVPVPEPKTVKNRVHWDVTGERDALLEAGATLLRARGEDRRWDVLADPDGNEFCVFAPG
jgi:catechol 2,3-dioxygenase-like lactoylglutathione lyase family enzyme